MGKSILLTLLLLLIAAASTAARDPSLGLDTACEKTPYAAFCEMLLQPSAHQFADNDPKKMGGAALNATLDRVHATKSYLIGLGVKTSKKPALKTAVMDCMDRLGRCETSLVAAAKELDSTAAEASSPPRKLGKAEQGKDIETATAEAKGCLEALQKAEGQKKAAGGGGGDDGKAGEGGGDPDVTMQAVRQANDTVLACYVAKAFVVLP